MPTSQTASEALTNGQIDEQQMLLTAESMQHQTQPTHNIKDNFVFDPTLAKTQQDDDEDPIKTAALLQDIIDCPVLKEADYINDDEFSAMYMYLKYDQLTTDTDKGNLYKISLPRGHREKRLRPTLYQLCVPKCYREQLLSQYHNFWVTLVFNDYIRQCLSIISGKLYAMT